MANYKTDQAKLREYIAGTAAAQRVGDTDIMVYPLKKQRILRRELITFYQSQDKNEATSARTVARTLTCRRRVRSLTFQGDAHSNT